MLTLLKIFGFKEKKIIYPQSLGIIKLNDVAKQKGIFDDENKIIEIYRHGKLSEIIKYTEFDVKALKELEGIPILEEPIENEEEINFDLEASFGTVSYGGGNR